MSHRMRMLRRGPRTSVLAASIGALVASGGVNTALGQDNDDAAADEEVVIVTGTRIRRDDFSSPNATTVVSAEDMRNLGVTSVADMVNQLPNNIASNTPQSTANDNFNMGASIANLRGLNTSSGTRTLTLVDSRRFVSSNNGGSVDLNMIPTALVGRIETVTGGASATYGADAMAGVVNVILDNNIEGVRVDLSYNETGEGDGQNVNLSIGTGFELFEGRGSVTVGYDHSDQDGIFDCTTRAYCRDSRGIIQNGAAQGVGFAPPTPYSGRSNIIFDGQPEWLVLEGLRYHVLPEGVLWGSTAQFATPDGVTDPSDLLMGVYRLNEAGTDVLPYLDNLTDAQRALSYAEGVRQDTPWGEGNLTYKNLSLLPENERDNLFTRFSYDFENGISVETSLTWSQSESLSTQNSARQTQYTGCVMPDNAFLDPSIATQNLIDVIDARRIFHSITYEGVGAHSLDFTGDPARIGGTRGDGNCRPAPFIGTSFVGFNTGPGPTVYDFPRNGGTFVHKDLSPFIDRTNTSDTETTNFSVSVTGDLFEGSSWTWDAYLNYGETERSAIITDWQSEHRLEMSLFSIYDDELGPVCATDPRLESQATSTDIYDAAFAAVVKAKWDEYLIEALQNEAYVDGDVSGAVDQGVVDAYFENLRFGCAPINLFGTNPGPGADALAYAFPEMTEGTENTQEALSFTFSGEAWQGLGAGPLRMAFGIDWRENETVNLAAQSVYTGRDFAGIGTPGGPAAGFNVDTFLNFGDTWDGVTETAEAFVEFELPLLQDKPGADYLMINIADRRTRNETERTRGTTEIEVQKVRRYNDSWKASMVWQPVDMMRVRLTRSADTRAPSAQELFQTNSPALSTGAMSEIVNPFRLDLCNDPDEVPTDFNDPSNTCAVSGNSDANERRDLAEAFAGGNSQLGVEKSVTETLGFVFTPNETIPGLQISVDYYETAITGGIEQVNRFGVLQGCNTDVADGLTAAGASLPWEIPTSELEALVDGSFYCNNIDFGAPDPDVNHNYPTGDVNPYSNILSVATSAINVAPYWSRGIDYSVSYFTQLGGGGTISARLLTTRFLEQNVDTDGPLGRINVAGQTGSNGLNRQNFNLGTNYSPTPRISGNMFLTYAKNAFTVTGQVRYIGTGKLYIQEGWIAPGEISYPTTSNSNIAYASNIDRTVERSTLPSWTTLNLNFQYNFSRSRFAFDRFEDLSAYINIDNVGDRVPGFFSGSGAGGINTTFFSGLGRQYRMGVRMQF